MPYITEERQDELDTQPFGSQVTWTPGELNYVMTRAVENYRLTHGDRYATFNDIIGALESAKQEFYRRVVVPYEDSKMEQNGDVYAPVEDSHDDTGASTSS